MSKTVLAFVALTVLASASPNCAAATYTVTDIGTFGGPTSRPLGMNNLGQVVGQADTSSTWGPGFYCTHGFIWNSGVVTDIGALGGSSSSANAVSDTGIVVATAANNARPCGAFLLASGTVTRIAGLDTAMGINTAGTVAGGFYTDSSHSRPAVWSNGSVTDLGTFGGSYGCALDINDSGWVVGYAYDANNQEHGFVWNGTTMIDLGLGRAYAINDQGLVVGGGYTWQNGVRTELASFYAYAVNDLGQMVGCAISSTGALYAALRDNGTITSLASLLPAGSPYRFESSLEPRYGINNAGQIAAVGYILGQGHHALVLTPVPEPSSLAALTLGLLGVGVGLTRRRQMA